MTLIATIIIATLLFAVLVLLQKNARTKAAASELEEQLDRAKQNLQRADQQQRSMQADFEATLQVQRTELEGEARTSVARVQTLYERAIELLETQAEQIREHYEGEARQAIERERNSLQARLVELEPLKIYAGLRSTEADVQRILADALADANALRQEAEQLVQRERESAFEERRAAQLRAKDIRAQAEARLLQATRDAARIVADAEKRAEETGGEAFLALREKQEVERALQAIRNVIDGYGDRYVVPTHSLLDELAEDFGHTAAGEALRAAREQSQRMVEAGEAADCEYAEPGRRETAIRFVIDAFNGRVDASLSTVKSTNFGTLEQEIRDAFSMVNLNGQAFRNARIRPVNLPRFSGRPQ